MAKVVKGGTCQLDDTPHSANTSTLTLWETQEDINNKTTVYGRSSSTMYRDSVGKLPAGQERVAVKISRVA